MEKFAFQREEFIVKKKSRSDVQGVRKLCKRKNT